MGALQAIPCGQIREVLLSLFFVAEQENALEADRLVGTEGDAYAKIVLSDNLDFEMSRVLCKQRKPVSPLQDEHIECC